MNQGKRIFRSLTAFIGLTLLIAYSLYFNWRLLRQEATIDIRNVEKDGITVYEERFDELKRKLGKQDAVGYISNDSGETLAYYLTQYALAPVIVTQGRQHRIVIGNTGATDVIDPELIALRHLTPLKDFKNGIYLFSSESNSSSGGAESFLVGFHGNVDCAGMFGWAWDVNQPETPINVDIYDGDTLLATVKADLFRQDLLSAGIGNGRHGFNYALPARLNDGRSHSLRVKFSGTGIDLSATPRAVTCRNLPPSYEGYHSETNCQAVSGWAWDQNQPDTPINLDLYDGAVLVTTLAAGSLREDLLKVGKGNGYHAYNYSFTESLKGGQSHTIRVTVSRTDIGLAFTPKAISCQP